MCLNYPDDPQDCNAIIWVRRSIAILSLFGCLFIVTMIWLFKKYVAFIQRLILSMSVAAAMRSIVFIIGESHLRTLCIMIAYYMTASAYCVMFWVGCVTTHLLLITFTEVRMEKMEWLVQTICWGVPLIIAAIPLLANKYGPAGIWCWIINDLKWRMGLYYGELFLFIAFLIISFLAIGIKLRKEATRWLGSFKPDDESRKSRNMGELKTLIIYPLIYLGIYIVPVIYRIKNSTDENTSTSYTLAMLTSILIPLSSLLNAVAYGLDKDMRSRLTFWQIRMQLHAHFSRSSSAGPLICNTVDDTENIPTCSDLPVQVTNKSIDDSDTLTASYM